MDFGVGEQEGRGQDEDGEDADDHVEVFVGCSSGALRLLNIGLVVGGDTNGQSR